MGRNLYGPRHSIVKELKWPTHLSCFADGQKVGATHLARESIPWENTCVRHTSQPGCELHGVVGLHGDFLSEPFLYLYSSWLKS